VIIACAAASGAAIARPGAPMQHAAEPVWSTAAQRPSTARSPSSAPGVAPGVTQGVATQPAAAGGPRIAEMYAAPAQRIIEAALAGTDAYCKLEELCDDIGNRLSGSPGLEKAVEWAAETMRRDGQENVRLEPVMVPKWVRGEESLEMLEPRVMNLPMLGLGGSVGTPPEGITAEVISVSGLEELGELGQKVAGRIVLFDVPMPEGDGERGGGYGTAVQYRVAGARWASQHDAVAALVRSVTTRSLRSPHTGGMNYLDARKRIPAASVSVEDAVRITRLQKRGIPVVVRLKMSARFEGMVPSANVVGELRGRESPDEIVVIGGHIDSWDVGQGANDDGGGCVTAMETINLLRKLGLVPRRTIRVVLWTNEENGLSGGNTYVKEHADELGRHVAAIESDSGVARPIGFSVGHQDEARAAAALERVRDIVTLLAPIGVAQATAGGGGADIGPMRPHGVPLLGLSADMSHYFDVHHTHADTLDKVSRAELDKHVAAMAVMAYVLADMPVRLGEVAP
jgi:hypothetical protein